MTDVAAHLARIWYDGPIELARPVLRAIEYEATLLAAQFPLADGRVPIEFDHLVLQVAAPGMAPVLADVAAGRRSAASPLDIERDAPQWQPAAGASFRLMPEPSAMRLWRQAAGGVWERVYRFTWQPRQLSDFQTGCDFHQTSRASDFTRKRVCTVMTGDGRVTISGNLLITTRNGPRQKVEPTDTAAWVRALQMHFGMNFTSECTDKGTSWAS